MAERDRLRRSHEMHGDFIPWPDQLDASGGLGSDIGDENSNGLAGRDLRGRVGDEFVERHCMRQVKHVQLMKPGAFRNLNESEQRAERKQECCEQDDYELALDGH